MPPGIRAGSPPGAIVWAIAAPTMKVVTIAMTVENLVIAACIAVTSFRVCMQRGSKEAQTVSSRLPNRLLTVS